MKLAMRTLLCTVVMAAGLAAVPAPSNATNIGHEGCTPGYWKNHTSNWQEAQPTWTFAQTYTTAKYGPSTTRANVANLTLVQALGGGGGPGLDGAAIILARAATAAWLNAAHEGLGYPWRRTGPGLDGRPALDPTVNAAFASNDRNTMLALATRLDNDNNLGCPLS